jgi:predicted ATPase
MPSLESIETDFTHAKTLSLFLKEAGVKRPWTAEDIFDGKIQAIALLAATFDPRIPILIIEEPENSVHPWAIRNFVQAFREASETKQIFLTTHSPILIDPDSAFFHAGADRARRGQAPSHPARQRR